MTLQTLDWIIVACVLTTLLYAALTTRRYTRSVSAFLAAERCGGRYMITVANNMASVGVITLVWYFEQNYEVGFTSIWWSFINEPVLIVIALSGWVIYRYRQTRAMTLAQFLEMRYSRNFRVFAGLVAYVAGIINFSIFPSVGSRFFMALCGLPDTISIVGVECSTYVLVMVLLLGTALLFTFLGGLIAVMVTDFIQGVFASLVFIAVMVFLLSTFSWDQIGDTLLAAPTGKSMVHPLKLGEEENFGIGYYLIGAVIIFYGMLTWQGTAGYNCCARDAHEAKMANILNGWRFRVLMLIVIVIPITVRTFMNHPDFAASAEAVHTSLNAIAGDASLTQDQAGALQNQLRTPYALAQMLPTGLLGLMCAAMLAAFISTHDTYLHSWGSILVQDVILPFRKRPFTPRTHMWLLRLSIGSVALFIFLFSLLFQHSQYIAMFVAITGAVFVGGAGSVIIGGLYWKQGTTAAAWGSMLTGMTLSLSGLGVKQRDWSEPAVIEATPEWLLNIATWADQFTAQEMTFAAIVCAVAVYVTISLLQPTKVHNMDKLLHRGEYALDDAPREAVSRRTIWLERLGISREFTGRDRIVTLITVGWPILWTILFIIITAYSLIRRVNGEDISDAVWLKWWQRWTYLILAVGTIVTVWFAIGGIRDLMRLYRDLSAKADSDDRTDDGRVEHDEID